MKSNRLDDIFQVIGGVPIIAELYIGMDKDEAEGRTAELNSYKTYGSPDYPLIHEYSISFEYDLFENEGVVKSIRLVFSQECSKNDSNFILDYLSKKIYHERIHKNIESNTNNRLLYLNVEIANYYYSCSFYNKDGHFVIQLTGTFAYPELYKAFYLVGNNSDLKSYIHKSLSFGNDKELQDKELNLVFPVYDGFLTICSMYLGREVWSASEAERIMNEVLNNSKMDIKSIDCEDITFEVLIDGFNRIDEIIIRLPERDKDESIKIINYFKKKFLIEKAHYYFLEGKEDFKIDISMSNDYLSIKAENPYNSDTGRRDIEITLSATQKDQSEIYEALFIMLSDKKHYGYFRAADVFYNYDNINNYCPFGAFDSFKDAIDAMQGD